MTSRKLSGVVACVAAMSGIASWASADTYSFFNITGNNAVNAASGAAQLSVDVTDAGSGQVNFTFHNAGPAEMSITDVYFDDGTLLGIASVTNGSGVDFAQGASPGDLPGGNNANPAFETTAGFSADSEPPAQPNGVNPGEELSIKFNLIGGQSFADTINALTLAGANGGLRIGLHVQGFANGGSESFINNPTPVPLPAAAWMGMALMGSGGAVTFIRRRRQGEIV
jgi:hypothetical protein